jgi:hypothetical protein
MSSQRTEIAVQRASIGLGMMVRRARPGRVAVAGMTVLLVALTGCSTSGSPSPAPLATLGPTLAPPSPTTVPTPTLAPAFPRNPAPIVEGSPYQVGIDPADFVTAIDNPFFPLTPGTKLTYTGDEHVEVTVMSETKLIIGVAATVVRDQVFVDGALEEDTTDWFAQDRDGNVWYFGEQTAELKAGKVVSTAGSWEAGVHDAQPGIVMLAAPQVEDAYRQEFLKGEAEDLAQVTALSGSVTVPAGSWSGEDVLVTEEWTPLETDVRERKTYARGVGLVETRTIKGGKEVLKLAKVEHVAAASALVLASAQGQVGPQPAHRRRQPLLVTTRRLS